MPIYEFECRKCGHKFDVWQKVSDPMPRHCARCRGPVRKLLSPPGIVFKGSGFHTTDYVQAKERKAEKESASGKSPEKAAEKAPSTAE